MAKPKIRFKGYTDDWEQRKFGDLGSVAMCKRIFKEQTSTDGDIPFYKIGTFGAEPDAFISRELFEEYRGKFQYPNIGDMLISASGTIGRTVEYKAFDLVKLTYGLMVVIEKIGLEDAFNAYARGETIQEAQDE